MIRRDIDVLAIGGIDRDLVLKVPYIPGQDEKVQGEFVGWLSGGPVANMACAASCLGLNVYAVCQVGDDGGEQILEDYQDSGVKTDFCRLQPGAITPFTVVLIPPSGEKVIILPSTMKSEIYDWGMLQTAMERSKFVYMLPHTHQFAKLACKAHAYGAKVMTDIEEKGDRDTEELAALLGKVDVASFNQFGVRSWTGEEPSPELAFKLLDLGPETILFTLGAKGAIGADSNGSTACNGISVQVVDSTGAGDTFHGAFLASRLQGQNLESALPFANAAGALSVTGMGPRGMLPTLQEVRDLQEASVR